jgi:hypothetical protein
MQIGLHVDGQRGSLAADPGANLETPIQGLIRFAPNTKFIFDCRGALHTSSGAAVFLAGRLVVAY